jgi:hypothetical protein
VYVCVFSGGIKRGLEQVSQQKIILNEGALVCMFVCPPHNFEAEELYLPGCSPSKANQRFGEIYRLRLQGLIVS